MNDARRLYGLRDENGPITAEWPGGIMRLILLEVGRRLVAAGRLHTVDHVFDLSSVEIGGALRGEPARGRRGRDARGVLLVGTARGRRIWVPAPVEPDLSGLPDAMGRMMRMSVNALALLEAEPDRAR